MPREMVGLRAAPSSIRFVTNFLRPVRHRRSVFTNENPFVLSVSRCIGGRVVPKETDETWLVSGNGKMKETVLMKIRLFLSVLHREYVVLRYSLPQKILCTKITVSRKHALILSWYILQL